MKKLSLFLLPLLLLPTGCDNSRLTRTWKNTVKQNYDEFLSEISANPDLIPVIVSTDQHGSIKANSKLYKYIASIVDFSKISKIISLGDTVTYSYDEKELDAYFKATECLPKEKRIDLVGNHERINTTEGITNPKYFDYGEPAGLKHNFVIKDSSFNVRYLAVDYKVYPWDYEDAYLTTAKANFIINEFSKTDPENIILMSHFYLFRNDIIYRDGSTFQGSESFIADPDVKASYIEMLKNRKAKTSGVLLDSDGVQHPYDFSNSGGKLLMSFHGHHHKEGYKTEQTFTEFLFQSMKYDEDKNKEPNCFYFAYVDPTNMKFKCWKNIEGYESLEINI